MLHLWQNKSARPGAEKWAHFSLLYSLRFALCVCQVPTDRERSIRNERASPKEESDSSQRTATTTSKEPTDMHAGTTCVVVRLTAIARAGKRRITSTTFVLYSLVARTSETIGVMAEGDEKKNDKGTSQGVMSQGVGTLYRVLFDELRFAKQQQWMTTNYLVLVLAAIFGCEKVIGTFLLLIAVGFGCYVLIDLQLFMGRTRKRLGKIEAEESKFFSPEERQVLHFEEYTHPYRRNLPTLIVLMGTALFGALLVGYALWRL